MERAIFFMITTFCFCSMLLLVITPCSATMPILQQHPLPDDDHQGTTTDHEIKLFIPTLPRKLRLFEKTQASGHGSEISTLNNKQIKQDMAGGKTSHEKEQKGSKPSGTWQEWVEEADDKSQFFTMDYSHVRRRRPIHNKALPVGP